MSGRKASAINNKRDEQRERYEGEMNGTLTAIAGAIAAGKLTPDDAFAWARIAACEVAERGSSFAQ